MHPEFPDEDIMALFEEKLDKDRDKWIVSFDGVSNVLGHGVEADWSLRTSNAYLSRSGLVLTAPITWLNTKHVPWASR